MPPLKQEGNNEKGVSFWSLVFLVGQNFIHRDTEPEHFLDLSLSERVCGCARKGYQALLDPRSSPVERW